MENEENSPLKLVCLLCAYCHFLLAHIAQREVCNGAALMLVM